MELTYLVKGADGKQYGPATLDQLGVWIREGRLQAQAQLKRSDMEHWSFAKDFIELQPLFQLPAPSGAVAGAPPAQAGPTGAAAQANPAAVMAMKSGASWFYWVAGLSIINSVISFSGGRLHFIFGLGFTEILDALAYRVGRGQLGFLALDVLVAGVFVLFGIFASQGHTWAFITGMALFALDGLILVLGQDWFGVAFHAFVLFCLIRGLIACRQARAQ